MLSVSSAIGKTTVALGLASAVLNRGVRSPVADLDPRAALDPAHTASAVADVLASREDGGTAVSVGPRTRHQW